MKAEKAAPLTTALVANAQELAKQSGILDEQIINRIHYIMVSVFNLFKKKDAYWYFYGAGEGEVGNLWSHYGSNEISIVADNCPGEEMVIIDKFGDDWGFGDSIPTRWLFEDFEKELTEGKLKYEQKELDRKAKQKAMSAEKKQEDLELIKIAKKKLSKAELAALKRSL
jgi:hypothetical protein